MSAFPNSPPPPGPLNTAPMADGPTPGQRQQLSPEEQKVIQACQSESFWYRSIPLSILLSGTAHVGVMRGFLKPHPSWGTRPKVILGSIVGYFLGKFSYVDVCADKFLVEAPDSNIAEAIRVRRGLPTRGPQEQQQQDQYQEPASPFQPVQQPSPIYQNQASPTFGQHGLYQEQDQEQQGVEAGGYDEMRKRNREAGQAPAGGAAGSPYQILSPPTPPTPAVPDYPVSRARVIAPKGQGTNKYGDEGFE